MVASFKASSITALLLTGFLCQASEVVPYAVRLKNVQSLSESFPLRGPKSGKNRLGEWAGIYYFTRWQLDSGRDRLPLWEVINRQFTIEPLARAAQLESSSGMPNCAGDANPKVCTAWQRVFAESKANPHSRRGRKLLWRAHTLALVAAVNEQRQELEHSDVPADELKFWRGRICLVLWLFRRNFPTKAEFIVPIVKRLEPPCAPLGLPGCRVRDLRSFARRQYVRLMIHRGRKPEALDRCLAKSSVALDVRF